MDEIYDLREAIELMTKTEEQVQDVSRDIIAKKLTDNPEYLC